MKAILTPVVGGMALRTESVDGVCDVPCVGESFRIYAASLTEGADVRLVQTSRVVDAQQRAPAVWNFHTETGSLYRLEETA